MTYSEGSLPTPKSTAFVSRFAPYSVKAAIVEGNYEPAMQALTRAITGYDVKCPMCKTVVAQKAEEWAVIAWMKAAGAIGEGTNILVQINQRLGVASEEELHELVGEGRKMRQLQEEGVSDEQAMEDAVEVLSALLRRHPEARKGVLAKLGSWAEEVNGDGG